MKFSDQLYELRKKAGYSQEELAVKCDVSRQSVSKWENGSAYPEVDKLVVLAGIFDVSVDFLLGRSEQEKKVITIEVPSQREYEYKSKWHILGVPLIHVHFYAQLGWRFGVREKRKRCVAKGVIAIGNSAVGAIAIGFFSVGFLSIGLLSLGVFVLGMIGAGFISVGLIALAYVSFGIISIGVYAMGVLSIGAKVACGVVAVAPTAIGVLPNGTVEYYDTHQNGRECIMTPSGTTPYQEWLKQANMPAFIKAVLSLLPSC